VLNAFDEQPLILSQLAWTSGEKLIQLSCMLLCARVSVSVNENSRRGKPHIFKITRTAKKRPNRRLQVLPCHRVEPTDTLREHPEFHHSVRIRESSDADATTSCGERVSVRVTDKYIDIANAQRAP
jgi:hypothetical protein